MEDVGSPQQGKCSSRLFWTPEMDGCMLEVFLAHLAQGLKTHQGWKKDVTYSAIKKELKENLGLDLSMTNIENRIKTMRKDVTTFKTLSRVSNSGFRWDEETQKLTADTHVWEDALKVHPEYSNFRKKILPRFSEWIEVLGDHTAHGCSQKTVHTAGVTPGEDTNASEEMYVPTQYTNAPFPNTVEHVDLDADEETHYAPTTPNGATSQKLTKLPQKRRRSAIAGLKDEMGKISNVVEGFVDVRKEKNQLLKEKNNREEDMWNTISAYISETTLTVDQKVEALELFSGNEVENLKHCFLRIPKEARQSWILKKLRNGTRRSDE